MISWTLPNFQPVNTDKLRFNLLALVLSVMPPKFRVREQKCLIPVPPATSLNS